MDTLTDNIKKLSTLEEKCVDGNKHNLVPFVYEGTTSDFEEVCAKFGCGQIEIYIEGIYSHHGLIHYVDSERYTRLLEFSEEIRNKREYHRHK
jgi:hypothetical protein